MQPPKTTWKQPMCAVSAIAELAWHSRRGILDTFAGAAAGQRIRCKRPGWLVRSMSCGGSLPNERGQNSSHPSHVCLLGFLKCPG